jgi:hypothetical protein
VSASEIDIRALAEVLADVLTERGLVVATAPPRGRVLDAAGVAVMLGRDRQWVCDHADELGAFRYGDGRVPVSALTPRRSSIGSGRDDGAPS